MNAVVEDKQVALEEIARTSSPNPTPKTSKDYSVEGMYMAEGIYVILSPADKKQMVKFVFLNASPEMQSAAKVLQQRLENDPDFTKYILKFYAGANPVIQDHIDAYNLFEEYKAMKS